MPGCISPFSSLLALVHSFGFSLLNKGFSGSPAGNDCSVLLAELQAGDKVFQRGNLGGLPVVLFCCRKLTSFLIGRSLRFDVIPRQKVSLERVRIINISMKIDLPRIVWRHARPPGKCICLYLCMRLVDVG